MAAMGQMTAAEVTMHRHPTKDAADLVVDDLLGMSDAAFGRVDVLRGDFHGAEGREKRDAIRLQLRAFVLDLDPDLKQPFARPGAAA